MKQYDEGYIKLNRSFSKWEWYNDINMRVVFIHCLLSANWQDKKWRGIVIKKGSFITSRNKFASEIGLSPYQVLRCWKKLESTGEISKKCTSEYTLIIVNNWDKFQTETVPLAQQAHSDRTTTAQQAHTTKEYKEIDRMKDRLINNKELCDILGFYSLSKSQYLTIIDEWLPLKSLDELADIVDRAKGHNPKNLFSYVHKIIMKSAPKETTNLVEYDWWSEEDE